MRIRIARLAMALATARAASAQSSTISRIDEFVRADMARQKIPGVAITVVKDGAVVKIDGYGYANLEHQVPVQPATIFQSGSLGKQFTAMAVMLQVEDGKLALTDPLTKYFPDAPPPSWRSITVQHLLTQGVRHRGKKATVSDTPPLRQRWSVRWQPDAARRR